MPSGKLSLQRKVSESLSWDWPGPKLVITGYSGSGKTTLIEHLVPQLRQRGFCPAVLKHSDHAHALDLPGKDSSRFFEAGAAFSAIQASKRWAWHQPGELPSFFLQGASEADWLILEGFKSSAWPKLVCVHPEKWIPPSLVWNPSAPDPSIWGYLVPSESEGKQLALPPEAPPIWERNALNAITEALIQQAQMLQQQQIRLKAAVLIGGRSSRMQSDKAALDYGQGPHAEALARMLMKCPEVQEVVYAGEPRSGWSPSFRWLGDRFLGFGPLGGLLTLFESEPKTAWLVLACDLPAMIPQVLSFLIKHRHPLKTATLFESPSGWLEPLVAIYEPALRPKLYQALLTGNYSFQSLFDQMNLERLALPPEFSEALFNCNTPEERLPFLL